MSRVLWGLSRIGTRGCVGDGIVREQEESARGCPSLSSISDIFGGDFAPPPETGPEPGFRVKQTDRVGQAGSGEAALESVISSSLAVEFVFTQFRTGNRFPLLLELL